MHFFRSLGRFIDYPSAIAGAVIMGLIVGFVNMGFGWWPALTAAMKQAAYTFFFGGLIIRLLYLMTLSIHKKWIALVVSAATVSTLTIILVFAVHSMKGTPRPFESTLPTIILAPPGFFFLAWRKRKSNDASAASQ
jgi:hypothetical protein